jgi:hypothetical protein
MALIEDKTMKAKMFWFIGSMAAASVFAQSSGGDFDLVKSTIDSGGGVSSGGTFSLTGTIGQPDANQQVAMGGEFVLAGGFWANATVNDLIFKDSFETQ